MTLFEEFKKDNEILLEKHREIFIEVFGEEAIFRKELHYDDEDAEKWDKFWTLVENKNAQENST